MTATHAKVTRNGQVSIPAAMRHRWAAETVLVIDRGDYAIVRPIPDDPVSALRGAHSGPGPASDQVRATEREGESDRAEQRTAPSQRRSRHRSRP